MEVVKPQKPPYAETHFRGQPSAKQLILILIHHEQELFERHELCQGDKRKLAADLMAPTASESHVKLREAAWAKRDEVWAEYHRACRKYEKAQEEQEEPPTKKSRDARKAERDKNKSDELQKAAEDEKESAAFLQKMQDKFDKDRETLRAELDALMENESTRPAIEAIMKHGMCECAGAHGIMCAWVLMTWFAAEAFRAEHGDAAPEKLASMGEDAVSSYLVDARVAIKVLRRRPGLTDLCTGEPLPEDPGVRWRRRGAVQSGSFRRVGILRRVLAASGRRF